MIAIVALTGAIAGFAALYLVLRFALQLRRDTGVDLRGQVLDRRWRRRRGQDAGVDAARLASLLPRAQVLRCRRSTARRSPAARANGLRLPG